MYWVLGSSIVFSVLLFIPKMDIFTTGKGINTKQAGIVTEVTNSYIKIGDKKYNLKRKDNPLTNADNEFRILPVKETWQKAKVKVGESVAKKELIAEGKTHIYFQANVWVFAILAIIVGIIWGFGMAAVYKFIPDYYPQEIGVVGGIVGVLGGLGGFICPILFGYLLEGTGLWSSSWLLMFILSTICFVWMYRIVQRRINRKIPELVFEQINN
jgi:NNP family nitrate/nitrite transporter-like MFS transporter